VKSPGDALRDAQREWLHWGRANGLTVGVWHVEPKESFQATLFQVPAQPAAKPAKSQPAGTRIASPTAARSPQQRVEWVQAPDEPLLVPGALLTGVGVPLAEAWTTSSVTKSEIRVHGEEVRVLRWAAWRPGCLQSVRRQGRKVVERLWHHLPEPWIIPVAVICQPAPGGGLMEAAVIPIRRAGWWWPERFDIEPVVLPVGDQDTDPRTWGVHPDEAPLRGDHQVDPADLDILRAMVGVEPFAVGTDPRGPWLAVDPAFGLIWTSERIARRDLHEVLQEWRVSDQTHNG
jgi:hypothetical protein